MWGIFEVQFADPAFVEISIFMCSEGEQEECTKV